MVMLCFVLDLRSLSPSSLRDVQQEKMDYRYLHVYIHEARFVVLETETSIRFLNKALLQLANFYAVSASTSYKARSKHLSDRIGLCYILKDCGSSKDELKVAYAPRKDFNLPNFHNAVSSLPMDGFSPEINDSGALHASDMKLDSFLDSEVLYKWGGHEKDISKKAILISSSVPEDIDSIKKDLLMDAAEKCVSIEFLLLEPKSSHLGNQSETINNFVKQIGDLENCSFHTFLPDPQLLRGLVKKWLQELQDDIGEPLQARLIFKSNIFETVNCISCTLSPSATPLVAGFTLCQACKCHGLPLDHVPVNKSKQFSSCPVTGKELELHNVKENSLKVGEHTVLLLPSLGNYENLQLVSQPVDLNVIERTSLASLNEAVLLGTSFLVSPSAFCDTDDVDKSELNSQVFQGLCSSLHSLDQGLVCSSKCNIETKTESLFHCYYLLEPSYKGLMLLRRLAGSEEALPFPDVSQLTNISATSEIGKSVLASLFKIEERDYDPSQHERGFHQKLNSLVKRSVLPGSVDPITTYGIIEPDVDDLPDYSNSPDPTPKHIPRRNSCVTQDQVSDRITSEWESLMVYEAPKTSSPTFIPKLKQDQVVASPQCSSRKIDENTSRILERLEPLKQLKVKYPVAKSTSTVNPTKPPLVPFPPIHGSELSTQSSQPIKPNFQRNKRKQR